MVDKMAPLGPTELLLRLRTVISVRGNGSPVQRCAGRGSLGNSLWRETYMSEQTRELASTQGTEGFGVDWASRGACRTSDPDALFVQGAEQNRAKQVCLSCV